MINIKKICRLLPAMVILFSINIIYTAQLPDTTKQDRKVKQFLDDNQGKWRNWNISVSDGEALFNLIVENNYTSALEIGTSTGHSAIWMAWALSKTGGKLITVEINEERYQKALKNFKAAGVSDYIDARLADAHELVPKLKGPFDFVFVDADKTWYKRYLDSVLLKMEVGGCFSAHNVLNRSMNGIPEFMDYVHSISILKTEIIRSSSSGISASYKTEITE